MMRVTAIQVFRFLVRVACHLFFSSTMFCCASSCAADWQYISSSVETGFSRPLFRTLALSTEPLPDIQEQVTYRGNTRRYAFLRYGTLNSRRVAVVLDEVSRGDFDLYVDANRDRTIVAKEKVPGAGRLRKMALDAELLHVNALSELLSRQVVFRRGIASTSLSFATLGYVQGHVELDGQQLRARRVDGDGDGLFSAARDRVWIDVDENELWDAFAEQFPYLPILKFHGKRYAVGGDSAGQHLTLQEIDGSGTVRLTIKLQNPAAKIVALDVMLAGRDGSAVTLHGADESIDVPVGTYTVNNVQVTLKNWPLNTPWSFVFSRTNDRQSQRSFTVAKDQEVSLDPIGLLHFRLENNDSRWTAIPGAQLTVNPRLYTEDGLLINSSSRGAVAGPSASGSNSASISLRDDDGLQLSNTSSGFA